MKQKMPVWYKRQCRECNGFQPPNICHKGDDGLRIQRPTADACRCFEPKTSEEPTR